MEHRQPDHGPDAGAPGRRRLLIGSAAAAAGGLLPARPGFATGADPFTLGVASGYPGADGFVLWTRLAPVPDRSDGGLGPADVDVRWEVAEDDAMRRIAAHGTARATAAFAHSVHVEVAGLAADRPYWYRFAASGRQSRIGRTRTLPRDAARPGRFRIAVASCQNIEHGHFAAYRHLVADRPDLIVHVGDYIYEGTWGRDLVRPLGLPEARTLAQYRERHTRYRLDPDLQAAHAAAPWMLVWDDHEVSNDYADATPEHLADAEGFLERRAAAYRAWYEHMPVPSRMAPRGASMAIHTAVRVGDLLTLNLLDHRQYRSPQACPAPGRAGGNAVVPSDCSALADPARTVLGFGQEAWLGRQLRHSTTRWNLIGQQTLMAPLALARRAGAPTAVRTDGWDGYPAARQRLVDALTGSRVGNPVVLGGDLHAFYVADLNAGTRPGATCVAAEFVCTSITSQAGEQPYYDRQKAANPHLRYVNGTQRGYLRLTLGRSRVDVDLMGLDDVRDPASGMARQAAWVVEAGRPGARPA